MGSGTSKASPTTNHKHESINSIDSNGRTPAPQQYKTPKKLKEETNINQSNNSTKDLHETCSSGSVNDSTVVVMKSNSQISRSNGTATDKNQDESTDNSENIEGHKTTETGQKNAEAEEEEVLFVDDELTKAQQKFDAALRISCDLSASSQVLEATTKDVRCITLHRAPPSTLNICDLMKNLPHLQEVDISSNHLGPASFRAMMYAMCQNATITSLNMSDNQTDTDSSKSIGEMLKLNKSLGALNVSGNYLGKDYFSRCVGPALAENSSLAVLKCESIGTSDAKALAENLVHSKTLTDLNLSHNELSDSSVLINGLVKWLEKGSKCPLQKLELRNCGLNGTDMQTLCLGIKSTENGLQMLNISGNKIPSSQILLDCVLCCASHSTLSELKFDDTKVAKADIWKADVTTVKLCKPSTLRSLSLCGCSLNDSMLSAWSTYVGVGNLSNLVELGLSNNNLLTCEGLRTLLPVLRDSDNRCSLQKLYWALNQSDTLADVLSANDVISKLRYLNLRKAKLSVSKVGGFRGMIMEHRLETLVLDGIKLAGSDALQDLLGGYKAASTRPSVCFSALSLGGCQMNDKDLVPLCCAIKSGLPLRMLKLSGNRLTDKFVQELAGALKEQPGHPLSLMDLSSNKIKQDGAKILADVLNDSQSKSNLRSLNISSNSIAPEGVEKLVSALMRTSLTHLNAGGQDTGYEEENMDSIYQKLAESLGLPLKKDGDKFQPGIQFPSVPHTFNCKLLSLGGYSGELGQRLDSAAICTDFQKKRKPYLTFQHVLELASALKGYSNECLLSGHEWNDIISAQKDAPSWLQIPDARERAIYVSHLAGGISVQKMEAIFELEADCSIQEIFLCKDQLTRKNNGFAWVLMSDVASVKRAVDFFHSGEAHVLGSSFVVSPVKVFVDDARNSDAETKARRDMLDRMNSRKQEDAAHRDLIAKSYQESQDRHAYRLAHPAYADGRIW